MKHMKRMLSVILTIALAFSCALPASAAGKTLEEVTWYANALNHLALFLGTNNGYELEAQLTREQAITMVVRLLGAEEEALAKNYPHPFTDVPAWAQPYVGYAYHNQITKGISATLFGAGQPVTESQFMTFLLRLLKYEEGVDFTWNAAFDLAKENGLYQEFATTETGFIRGGAVVLCWQFLNQKAKDGEVTIAEELISKNVFPSNAFAEAEKIAEGAEVKDLTEKEEDEDDDEPVTPPAGDDNEDEPITPPAGGGDDGDDKPANPPAGGGNDDGDEPTNPPAGGGDDDGDEPTNPPAGGGNDDGDEPTNPPAGGGDDDGDEPTNPPAGGGDDGGDEPTNPPAGGGDDDDDEPTNPPAGGGDDDDDEPTNPPAGGGDDGGDEPTNPPAGGGDDDGDEPTNPPAGGGDDDDTTDDVPVTPPSGGGSNGDNTTEDIPLF